MNFPRTSPSFATSLLKSLALASIVGGLLSSCSVSPEGPATDGASHGSLGSTNMSDYYYHKQAGYTYAYSNVEKIYDASGSVVSTLTGANDTVRTLGYSGIAPSGDSMFKVAITYRVSTAYAGRGLMDMFYVCKGESQKGGFIDGGATITGMKNMDKRPRPVSTDTILAGVVGRVRTVADDFTNTGTYTWQTDTLWLCSHGDSTYLWQHNDVTGVLDMERLLFCRDFVHNTNWKYNLIPQESDTYCKVHTLDMTLTVPAGTFVHTSNIEYYTPNVSDNMPITEYKYFAVGTGPIKEYDHWTVTTDGVNFNDEDFTRSLISLTH